MEVKLSNWGNSVGIRIPSSFLKELKLNSGDTIIMKREDSEIRIKKKADNILNELFEGYEEHYAASEVDWGEPKGNEIW